MTAIESKHVSVKCLQIFGPIRYVIFAVDTCNAIVIRPWPNAGQTKDAVANKTKFFSDAFRSLFTALVISSQSDAIRSQCLGTCNKPAVRLETVLTSWSQPTGHRWIPLVAWVLSLCAASYNHMQHGKLKENTGSYIIHHFNIKHRNSHETDRVRSTTMR